MITIKELTLDDETAFKLMRLINKHEPEIWEVFKPALQQALNKHDVINPVCPLCKDKGYYSFGGSFGGAVQTVRCSCGANGL